MNEAEVRRLVEKNNKGDTYEAIYGPVKIAGSVIWEVWVAFEDEWMARFVEEPETGPVKIYDTFQQLAIRLNDRHLEIMERLKLAEQAKATCPVSLALAGVAERTDWEGRLETSRSREPGTSVN